MRIREIEELEQYRTLVEEPTEFKEGFSWRTVLGAFFVGFVMMPGSIYLGLVAGQSMGPAAEWTTIILFAEVARRSFQVLSRQEIYILYYMAGGLASTYGALRLSGGVFAGLVWNQFLRASAPAGLGDLVPNWVAPPPDSIAVRRRTFMHPDWYPAIAVAVSTYLLSRVAWFTFGYVLFRITSDGEKLPFPLAPVSAQAATALAEVQRKEESWRWRIFSIGAMIGVAFGMIYVAVPTLTSVLLLKPLQILPIPWIDFTQGTERFLPGAATGIGTNLADVFLGFVLPFWMVAGSFAAAVATLIINPVAQVTGHMPTWRPGMEATRTVWAASIDIWLSFSIGTALAVAVLGVWKMVAQMRAERASGERKGWLIIGEPPPGRGDFPVPLALAIWAAATAGYVILCRVLVPRFPIWWVIVYGYIWTPIQSYINARMKGLTGQFVGFPMIREATFILSGYKGVDIWFAPIPLANYGDQAQRFREIELTGTKFTSVVWTELLMFPIMLFCSFLFWSYIWRLKPIPSEAYPYAQKYWDFQALNSWLWFSSTTEGGHRELFLRAIKPWLMVGGLVFGLGSYFVLNALRLPVLLIYGFFRGLGTMPHFVFPQFFGALLGYVYLQHRFGPENWRRWTPVLYAGFTCGMGLVGMLAIAFSLVSQSISQLPF